jgi:hypothetical protein
MSLCWSKFTNLWIQTREQYPHLHHFLFIVYYNFLNMLSLYILWQYYALHVILWVLWVLWVSAYALDIIYNLQSTIYTLLCLFDICSDKIIDLLLIDSDNETEVLEICNEHSKTHSSSDTKIGYDKCNIILFHNPILLTNLYVYLISSKLMMRHCKVVLGVIPILFYCPNFYFNDEFVKWFFNFDDNDGNKLHLLL